MLVITSKYFLLSAQGPRDKPLLDVTSCFEVLLHMFQHCLVLKTITNRHCTYSAGRDSDETRKDVPGTRYPGVLLFDVPRPLLCLRGAAAATRSLKLDACLSSMQARRMENALSMNADDGWISAVP